MPQALEDGKVGSFHYVLKDDAGSVIDSSTDTEPTVYLHGAENIVPGLEAALVGKTVGDVVDVTVTPTDGYGEPSGQPPQRVPRHEFPPDVTLGPGMGLRAQDSLGQPIVIYIAEVTSDWVSLTADHPMAGKNLNFHVEVVSVRDGTADEVAQGRAHGPGCNHHHH